MEETVQSELALAVLACLMVYHKLANLVKTGILGKIRNVAVHVAVDLNVLDYLVTVCLESAVEVVQVSDTRNLTCGGIE